jgi:hypothetical protein
MTRWVARAACLLACATWLGCAGAASPPAQQGGALDAPATGQTAPSGRMRLFYIGLALYPESWSANDVVELETELRRTTDFDIVPLIASNFTTSPRGRYPIASAATIATLMNTAAASARPDDIVLVHISTHGAPGVLASKIGNLRTTAVTAGDLAHMLQPLGQRRTVLILSACYSGSLIGELRAPRRIIITAARADRSSFGCAAGNRHTFFGEAELYGFAEPDRSLHDVFTDIRDAVAHMERAENVRPSDPQVSVGADVADLYEAKLF